MHVFPWIRIARESVHDESQEEIAENQCHFCMKMMENADQLMNHFQVDHSQFYNTMMTATNEKLTQNVERSQGVSYAR